MSIYRGAGSPIPGEALEAYEDALAAAAASAAAALVSETTAAASAAAAALSESAAAASEAAAALSESAAAASEIGAGDWESLAQEWAENAEDVAVTGYPGQFSALHHSAKASAQRVLAETARTGAETAETNAETAQTAAELAETNAETAQTASEAARDLAQTYAGDALSYLTSTSDLYDQFDDRYLGAKAANPTLDNDGDALIEGAMYWNSVSKEIRVYNGTTWVAAPDGFVLTTGDTMTGNLTVPMVVTDSAMSHRNKIINGAMLVSQRGTSFTGHSNGYTLDRFAIYTLGSPAVFTVTQEADAPSSVPFTSCLKATVTTADASIATGDACMIIQSIEGYNIHDLVGRTFTLSFWVKASVTGTYCVSFSNTASDRSYIKTFSISAANTWEFKTITVSGGLTTAGTWDYTNGTGLSVYFTLAAGTTYQTTADAWQTGAFIATSAQVNAIGTIGNSYSLTAVQLEVGDVATPFEHRSFGVELELCRRYYTAFTANTSMTSFVDGGSFFIPFGTPMRTSTPTVTNPLTDATFTASGSPGSGTWGLQIPGVVSASKSSGTFNWSVQASDKGLSGFWYGAIVSANTVWIQTPDLVFQVSDEL